MNEEKLKDALKEISQTYWDANTAPILLSNLPPEIKKVPDGADYKNALKGKSLKAFIKASETLDSYKIVEHKTEKARIGIVPANVEFEFPNPTPLIASKQIPSKFSNDEKLSNRAIDLLNILAKLSDEDLEKIVIPASIFVKLLK